MNQDEQHLKLLSIFHYIVGGLFVLFPSMFTYNPILITLSMIGLVISVDPNGEPTLFGGINLIILGGALVLLSWTLAALIITAGRCLAKRTRYMYCFVIAAISCMFVPFGTVLGIFTIIVLSRESVKAMFGRTAPASATFEQSGPPPTPGA